MQIKRFCHLNDTMAASYFVLKVCWIYATNISSNNNVEVKFKVLQTISIPLSIYSNQMQTHRQPKPLTQTIIFSV